MNATKYTLFTNVGNAYQNMLAALQQAEHNIHMIYFSFDHGQWADKISLVLKQKAASGVQVQLMVDELGLVVDNFQNAWRNRNLMDGLRAAGVRVDIFRPTGRRLSQFNRLHVKICAIDRHTVFVGGSNIGDHYPHWRDSNLRLDGDLGNTFAHLYLYLRRFSQGQPNQQSPRLADLHIDDASLRLTLPGHRQDIRRAMLGLILNAENAITIRTWYFLPDREVLNALLSQAENDVHVTILLSDRTRIPFIDTANRFIGHKLAKSGACVFRYKGRYMHAKEVWNDKGDILFGSANVDRWALRSNFECDLQIHDPHLARRLQQVLAADLCHCRQQRVGALRPQFLPVQ
jgi:cardiolipin synthase